MPAQGLTVVVVVLSVVVVVVVEVVPISQNWPVQKLTQAQYGALLTTMQIPPKYEPF